MLDKWSESDGPGAEDEILEKLALVDKGFLTGASVSELVRVGIFEYQSVFTSQWKLVYRRIGDDTEICAVAGPRQDCPHASDEAPVANLMGWVGPACKFCRTLVSYPCTPVPCCGLRERNVLHYSARLHHDTLRARRKRDRASGLSAPRE